MGFCSYTPCSSPPSLSPAWESPCLQACLVNAPQSSEGSRSYPTSAVQALIPCLWCPAVLSVLSPWSSGHSVVSLCVQDSNNSFNKFLTPQQSVLASLLKPHPRPFTQNIYSFYPVIPKVINTPLSITIV